MARSIRHPVLAMCGLVCVLLLAAACAGGVRGESPFAQVTGWRIDGRDLSVDLRLRNVNDEPLVVRALDLDVVLDDSVELFRHRATPGHEIAAGGFETLALSVTASEEGTALLERLASGERASLAYRLEGTVHSEESGDLPIEREGHIYTVPGRPGEFR